MTEIRNKEILEQVKKIFTDYLELHKQRKTTERFQIIEEIYSRSDHFDAETLFADLQKKKSGISRATVYNTLELLVSCNLVMRQQFGNHQAFFEKSFGFRQHDHLICKDCGKVVEFCDPRIQQINSVMGELLNFKVQTHSLILYGECIGNCEVKKKSTTKKTGAKI